ncbi:tRNA(Ile)-lysidine synthase [Spiroplasma helicoides]|uniref:tRNA(Ile)-lysidine synthase n=1 Tax=Spiroplasma helicoides TaxID=216938 RepID=A0A1B3SJ71_9MOLU|nr:tRNA lysidine(34) synthetase TilS [Spiroplasma helicoides]AOG59967.1 tRNA(Ile)-lysidine synthase [Spiroplasma helicoides]
MKICNKKKYVVGLSGGPDSIFLLDNLIKKVKKEKIIACHVNYNFRKDSNVDQKICEDYCKKNNIDLRTKVVDVSYDNLKQNFEAWARELRYDFFVEVLKENQFDKILIAHNMNDDIETYIMQVEKKILPKYYGLKKQTTYKNCIVYRPILEFKKSEILEYLRRNNIHYAVDSTNLDIKYTRNKIRSTIDENAFEEILIKKNVENKKINQYTNKINKLITEKITKKTLLNNTGEFNERFLFSYLENKGFGELIYSRKKNFLKEILKQLKSEKSYVKIAIGNLLIIKDRENLYFENIKNMRIIDKNIFDLDEEEKRFFKLNDLKGFEKDTFITNNWEKYRSQLIYKNKKLSDFYKKNKISYFDRFSTPIIYNKTSKNILNNLL